MLALVAALALQTPTPIFDGKSLDGWTKVGGGQWSVEDGAIVGRSKPGEAQGLLVYKYSVKDFHARAKFKISAGDSGFYFRVDLLDKDPYCAGFQVEIDTSPETGGIYETEGRGWVAFPDAKLHDQTKYKAGEWTDLEVTARGTRYLVKVNGVTITDIDDPQGRKVGRLALQLHGNMEMDVAFRDLTIVYLRT